MRRKTARRLGLVPPTPHQASQVTALLELAELTSAELRQEMKEAFKADATEISGVMNVPCRHCHGVNHQYQYTDPEWLFIERAHADGQNGWPFTSVTNEFNLIVRNHAAAAYLVGKDQKDRDQKGGAGYSRNAPINPDCPQCAGLGEPMLYFADTRRLSPGAKRIFKGVKLKNGTDIEVMTIDRQHIRDMLARDLRVGIERKEIQFNFPRSPEEFDAFLDKLPARELETMLANMVNLAEGQDYHQVEPASGSNADNADNADADGRPPQAALPAPNRFSRGR